MRGAPYSGFSRRIVRISSRTSFGTVGRPGLPRRIFQVQNRRNPFRCQAITVSGLTMTRALRQLLQIPHSQAHKIRSTLTSLGRDAERCKTPSWWRRARFSSLRATRPRNEATSEATSAANSGPHGESKEERQLLIYQEDRSLREPQLQEIPQEA